MNEKHKSLVDILIGAIGYLFSHWDAVIGHVVVALTMILLCLRIYFVVSNWRKNKRNKEEDFEL